MSNEHSDFSQDELKHFAMTMAEWIINGHDCHDKKGFGIHFDNVRGIAQAVIKRIGPERFGPAITDSEVMF